MGRDNMVADRVYWPGLLNAPNGRTTLLYFAAAVPAVGFVNGAADLNAVNAAPLEGYAEARFVKRAAQSIWPLVSRARHGLSVSRRRAVAP
jgi:hypothetical protein